VSASAEEFARRRAALQRQCALQREQLAQSAAEIGADLRFVDRGVTLIRGTRVVPLILGAISALGMTSRAGRVIRLISRVWVIINTLQRVKRALR
jgi:hypothetical protein